MLSATMKELVGLNSTVLTYTIIVNNRWHLHISIVISAQCGHALSFVAKIVGKIRGIYNSCLLVYFTIITLLWAYCMNSSFYLNVQNFYKRGSKYAKCRIDIILWTLLIYRGLLLVSIGKLSDNVYCVYSFNRYRSRY